MRDYGKVHTSFWISDGMRRVSDDARLLALYLLTGQHTNMIGCFRLPDGYVSEDLAWTPERVSKGFDELSANGFATRDSSSKWVLIRNFLAWNSVENPNQGIAALRLFDQVPDKSSVKPELARVMASAISHISISKLKGSERVLQPFLNQEQEQEQEQEEDSSGHGYATPPSDQGQSEGDNPEQKKTYPDEFELVWSIYPKRAGGNSKSDAYKAWHARIREGTAAEEIYSGVERYAAFVKFEGNLNTQYVKQAKTFFGPGMHFSEPWAIQQAPGTRDPNQISEPDKTIPSGFKG
ncbi:MULTISPECIES: hypothetical protein [Raoultella]|uniref:hypothetical protein n=1 Tax=Raoultella TaxID=160674 RepID=UPI00216908A4|nr:MULTISPECIES: hypothetical protein [Raoultella]MCS4271178.1 hypothetical protein [Raoultella sp. BIGb0132]MCS4288513.1 hypothetical protein [Raoultella terrigena]